MTYIIYGMTKCNYCVRAKNLLSSKGVSFNYVDIKDHPDAYSFVVDHEGHETVPQVYTMNALGIMEHIGGYIDLVEHFENMSD